jgi:hypothetical protein
VKQIRKRITYANVMSSIAVFLVLGGASAYAAKKIGSNEIKGNSITTGKIKKEAVSASKIKKNSITTSKIANGAVTGAKLNLGTVGTVPNANHANTADNAKTADSAKTAAKTNQIGDIFYTANEGSAKTTILNLAGLTITAECPSGEDIQLEATTSVNHSLIDFYTPQDQDYEFNENFNVGETFDADDGHNEGTYTDIYSLHYANPNGQNVTVELRDSDPEAGPKFPGTGRQSDCYVGGYAITG